MPSVVVHTGRLLQRGEASSEGAMSSSHHTVREKDNPRGKDLPSIAIVKLDYLGQTLYPFSA